MPVINLFIRQEDGTFFSRLVDENYFHNILLSACFLRRSMDEIKQLLDYYAQPIDHYEEYLDRPRPFNRGLIVVDFLNSIIIDFQPSVHVGQLKLFSSSLKKFLEKKENYLELDKSQSEIGYQDRLYLLYKASQEGRIERIKIRNLLDLENSEDCRLFFEEAAKGNFSYTTPITTSYNTGCIVEIIKYGSTQIEHLINMIRSLGIPLTDSDLYSFESYRLLLEENEQYSEM